MAFLLARRAVASGLHCIAVVTVLVAAKARLQGPEERLDRAGR